MVPVWCTLGGLIPLLGRSQINETRIPILNEINLVEKRRREITWTFFHAWKEEKSYGRLTKNRKNYQGVFYCVLI